MEHKSLRLVVFIALALLAAWVAAAPNCDRDGDGFQKASGKCGGTDCNDNDASIYPGATEVCDGVDNNCDGTVDEGCGGGSSDKTAGWFGRVDLCDDTEVCPDAIRSDGVNSCAVIDPLLGSFTWDYWQSYSDQGLDPTCSMAEGDGGKVTISSGGRLHFITVTPIFATGPRYLVIRFPKGTDAVGAEIDCPDIAEPAGCDDNVKVLFRPDRLFKKKARWQALKITLHRRDQTEPPGVTIEYINPLYICRSDNGCAGAYPDPDLAILTTTGPDGQDLSEAELWRDDGTGTQVLAGIYSVPFTALFRRIPGS